MKKLYISILGLFLVLNVLSYSSTKSVVNLINKIDNTINPKLRFDVAKASGMWYLIYDNDYRTKNLQNITVDLAQEGQGYNYITKSYNIKKEKWNKTEERAWIQEDRKNIYFYLRKKGFVNYKNPVLYYDEGMNYLAIYFKKDNTIKILSRTEKIDSEDMENIMSAIKKQGYGVSKLKKIDYDSNLYDMEELRKIQEENEFYERLSRFGESGTINFDEAVEVPQNK